MAPCQPVGQIGEIGRDFGGDAVFGVFGAHGVDILDPRLMRHLHPAAERNGQQREAVGDDLAQNARPWLPPVTSTRKMPSSSSAG